MVFEIGTDMTYETAQHKIWRHISGKTASIHGAVPWTNPAHQKDWTIEFAGWTVYNVDRATYGIGRAPWKTQGEAQAWCDQENARLEDCRRRYA